MVTELCHETALLANQNSQASLANNVNVKKGRALSHYSMGRGSSWTIEEATALAKAWVKASERSVEGADMTSERFWSDVVKFFEEFGGSPARAVSALQRYWSRVVQPAVYVWAGLWASVDRLNASGSNRDDVVAATQLRYKEQSRTSDEFTFIAASEVLNKCPKFHQLRESATGPPASTPEVFPPEAWARPQGTKRAKEALKHEVEERHTKQRLVAASEQRAVALAESNKIQERSTTLQLQQMELQVFSMTRAQVQDLHDREGAKRYFASIKSAALKRIESSTRHHLDEDGAQSPTQEQFEI